jgi:hypothetical protein
LYFFSVGSLWGFKKPDSEIDAKRCRPYVSKITCGFLTPSLRVRRLHAKLNLPSQSSEAIGLRDMITDFVYAESTPEFCTRRS